jgi:putative ABC transport system permease protein
LAAAVAVLAAGAVARPSPHPAPGDQDDFMVRTLKEMASVLTSTTETMTWLLASIAAVSLVVGGIGSMNPMPHDPLTATGPRS